MRDFNSMSRGESLRKNMQFSQLGLPDKVRVIKRFVVYNCWDVNAVKPAKQYGHTLLSTAN